MKYTKESYLAEMDQEHNEAIKMFNKVHKSAREEISDNWDKLEPIVNEEVPDEVKNAEEFINKIL